MWEFPSMTDRSGNRCLSFGYMLLRFLNEMNGGRGWNRTTNLSIKSRMLCQLSYASNERRKAIGTRGWESSQ